MGRRCDETGQTKRRGRLLITLRRSDPATRASRRRKVKTGRRSPGQRDRASGHMPKMRRSSMGLKSMERRKSTVDFMEGRGAETRGVWRPMRERKSMPRESR